MNSTILVAGRRAHTKIVAIGVLGAIIFIWGAMAAHWTTGFARPIPTASAASQSIVVDRSTKGDRLHPVTAINKAVVGCDRAVSSLVPRSPSGLVVACLT
jgi:hypothetical protein